MKIITKRNDEPLVDEPASLALSRRSFLRYTGMFGLASTVAITACKKNDDVMSTGLSFGSGDVAILNYAYALEQLEAAFYTKVLASPYSGMSSIEASYFTDIRDHEIAHREFFKAALSSNALPALEVDFSSINFADRTSVLATAKAFEDLGVSAYNGAGKYLQDANYLLLAGKIVSVEARHAALIRDVISNGTFADNTVVDASTGLDLSRNPREVLAIAKTYIKTDLNATTLPNS